MRQVAYKWIDQTAIEEDRIVFIGSDLAPDMMPKMRSEVPERFLMEGICEQAITGMAAGMAMEGFIPYVNTITPFIVQRNLEQISVDICLLNLPVRLIANGAGMVYAPLGPTHTSLNDMAILRALPNMTLVSPCDKEEMARLMPQTLNWTGPMYIRTAKGKDKVVSRQDRSFEIGRAIEMLDVQQAEVVFISSGVMTQRALEVAEQLQQQGRSAQVLHYHTWVPFDEEALWKWIQAAKTVVTLEEHFIEGGLGSIVLEHWQQISPENLDKLLRLGFKKQFVKTYGTQNEAINAAGLSISEVLNKILVKEYG